MHLASESLGGFSGCDADGFAGADVDERGRDLSPVAKLQRALAQSASRDHGDRVGGATVDFDESDQPLAVFAAWIVDAEFLQPEHRQANAEHLPGAKMAVGLFRIVEI